MPIGIDPIRPKPAATGKSRAPRAVDVREKDDDEETEPEEPETNEEE